ncbi:MAG: tRNA lysidine(34) synthetase TilS [Pseudomonadota bacterium]
MSRPRLAAAEGDPARDLVFAELDRLTAPFRGPIGIAISGGSDSTALAVLAAEWADGRPLRAVTIDHGLRREARQEAEFAGALCHDLGIAHTTLTWAEGPKATELAGNLSAKSRAARHRLIAGWAMPLGISAVLLGHTLDDQAETVLMRLMRGSGVDGLAGIRTAVELGGACWLRPLLGTRRSALRALLEARGRGWIEDPTNDDESFDRVRVRKTIKSLDLDVDRLAQTAGHMARQRRVLENDRDRLAADAVRIGPAGEMTIELERFDAAEEDTRLAVLADAIAWIGGASYRPRFASLRDLLDRPDGRTLGGVLLLQRRGRLTLCRELAAVAPECHLETREAVWDNRWCVTRAPQTAPQTAPLSIAALGEAGLARLRVLRDRIGQPSAVWRSAPRAAQIAAPGLWRDGALVAAPMAGLLPSHSGEDEAMTLTLLAPPARFRRCMRL